MRRLLVILGHPERSSFCGALAGQYGQGARKAGAEVRMLSLGDLDFDPVLRRGPQGVHLHEPDLLDALEAIHWAEHLAFAYPDWWGGPPALLKGFLDRVLHPGFTFRGRPGGPWCDQLLRGRTGRILLTSEARTWHPWLPAVRALKRSVLEPHGVDPVRVSRFTGIHAAPPPRRKAWLHQAARLGAQDAWS